MTMHVSTFLDTLIRHYNFEEMEKLCVQEHKGTECTDLLIANLKIPLDHCASGYIYRIEILKAKLTYMKMVSSPPPRLMKSCEKTILVLDQLVATLEQTRADFQPLKSGLCAVAIIGFLDFESKKNFGSVDKTLRKVVLDAMREEDIQNGKIPLIEALGDKAPTFENAVEYARKEGLTRLNFNGIRHFSNEDLDLLVSVIPVVTQITLSSPGINDSHLRVLADHYPNLTSFVLEADINDSYRHITDFGVERFVVKCRQLQTLVLPFCEGLTTFGLRSIAQNCRQLRCLNLEGSAQSSPVDAKAFWELAVNCEELKKLNLNSSGAVTYDYLLVILIKAKKLTHLEVEGVELSEGRLLSLLELCKKRKLQHINLGSIFTPRVFYRLADTVPNLRGITLNTFVKDGDIDYLVQGCSQLRSINFCGSSITDAGVVSIATHGRQLRVLGLGCCTLTDASLIYLASSNLLLRRLDLPQTITDSSLHAIAQNQSGLAAVAIPCNHVTEAALVAFFQSCRKLEAIDLTDGSYRYTNATLDAIAENCKDLRVLDIRGNNVITKESVQNLITSCKKLRKLYLFGCLDSASIFEIRHTNPTLQVISSFPEEDQLMQEQMQILNSLRRNSN